MAGVRRVQQTFIRQPGAAVPLHKKTLVYSRAL